MPARLSPSPASCAIWRAAIWTGWRSSITERALGGIEAEARARWDLRDCLIIHRFGTMVPGDMIMMVATASPHRADAFQAAEFLMDYLKSRAPFWKKEYTRDGALWVDSKDADEAALGRWAKG